MSIEELRTLVQDTLIFLKEAQGSFVFGKEDDLSFFGKSCDLPPPKKIETPPKPILFTPPPEKKEPQEVVVSKPLVESRNVYTPPQTPPLAIDAILKKVAPEMTLSKVSTTLEPYVLLVTLSPTGEELAFYKNLAKAIQTHLKPAKILVGDAYERENRWNCLFHNKRYPLILAPETLKSCTRILPYYQEGSLGGSPILFLISSYSQEQKSNLWKELQERLK